MLLQLIDDNFVKEAPYLDKNKIIDFRMGTKQTGEKFLRIKTSDNQIYIKTMDNLGIMSQHYLEIPPYYSQEQRDNLIIHLRDRYNLIQLDIAYYLDISQATVSRVLRGISKGEELCLKDKIEKLKNEIGEYEEVSELEKLNNNKLVQYVAELDPLEEMEESSRSWMIKFINDTDLIIDEEEITGQLCE